MMKRTLFALLLLLITTTAFTQELVDPKTEFTTAEDYKSAEPQLLKAIDWYLSTPMNEDQDKKQDVSVFFLKWLIGSPTVTVELDENMMSFYDGNNPELLMVFMMGWTKYSLDHNSKDKEPCFIAGIKTVVEFYTKNKSFLKKNKQLEKYQKLMKNGKLETELEKQFSKQK